jgi:hypothetical protein
MNFDYQNKTFTFNNFINSDISITIIVVGGAFDFIKQRKKMNHYLL